MGAGRAAINIADTMNSGQVFLWRSVQKKGRGLWWYGVQGQEILRVDGETGRTSAYRKGGKWSAYKKDLFRDSDNPGRIPESMPQDDVTAEAARRYRNLRIIRQDSYQCMVSFITSANSNIRRITGNLSRMAETFGRPVDVGGGAGTMHLFPAASALAGATIREIRECGVGYRAAYIKEASEMVESGEIDFGRIREMKDYGDMMDAMLAIPGVGNKVADCIMLFSLERLDAFPLDRWMLRVLGTRYGDVFGSRGSHAVSSAPSSAPSSSSPPSPLEHLTDKRYRAAHDKIAEYFGPYAGYAQQWLFKMARDDAGASWRQKM
ncbi:MAG: DNA repair protein [Thaumarchaeota archaeon]|nr:DNA repair protein [Nitrososphaerota archaeon]